jgi:hypothetical protein
MIDGIQAESPWPGRPSFERAPLPRPKAVKREPFIKGPICLRWVSRAVRLRKPALAAGLALWFLRGVSRHDGPFKIVRSLRNKFQLSGPQMLRGLRALEAAKLVRFIKQGRGRCAVVEIIDLTPYRRSKQQAEVPTDPNHGLARSHDRAMIEGQPKDDWSDPFTGGDA